MLKDDELLERLESDFRTAGLDPRRIAMLCYVEKLTLTPNQVSAEHVEALRKEGFSDTDILHIAEVAAYYAYANRMASGLGIQLEEEA